ncbi:unnamed protein product [Closterium sp. NIES-53]
MPTDEGAWGAQEPNETTWGGTPADRDRRLLTEAEQRVADMEVLDSGRLVGIEPKPAASDQESGELVLSPGEYGHKATADTWHKRLGHPSQSTLNNTIKAAVLDKNSLLLPGGLEMKPVNRPSPYLICPAANLPHEPYPTHFPGAEDYRLMEKKEASGACSHFLTLTNRAYLATQRDPTTLFHGVRSFVSADAELAVSEEPDLDGACEAAPDPPIPTTSSGFPEFIPLVDAHPEDDHIAKNGVKLWIVNWLETWDLIPIEKAMNKNIITGKWVFRGSYALLVAYVDDILYVCSSASLGDRIEADLKKSLDLTVFTEVTQFLGLNISRTSSAIHLTASKYAESLAKRFKISTNYVTTPYRSTPTGHILNNKLSAAGLQLYQQQLGRLLFAAVTCRPDLAYVASYLAQFLRCPKEEHHLNLQRALHYFVATPTVGLIFNTGKPTDKIYLSGYVDADHAGDTSDCRSRTGYVFRLEPIGPISWNSSKQELVSLSTAEAEFIAACAATREGLYLKELLDEAKFVTPNQFTLQCDNQSAITIANKPGFVNRTKHISLRYFFVKDAIDKGIMRLVYCPTGDMAADSITKKLTRQKFHHCNQLSGVSETTG